MTIACVVVHKQFGGKKWSNTHCVAIGSGLAGEPTNVDLTTAGAGSTLDATTTGASPTNIIQAIVAFERLMHQPDVSFTDVLITDGKKNNAQGTQNSYATMAMSNLPGLLSSGTAQGAVVEPGAITLLVHRNLYGFGHKPGRLFLRGTLLEGNVQIGGTRLIMMDTGSAGIWAGLLSTAQAKLTPYFHAVPGANDVTYCLPLYMTPKQHIANPTVPVGELWGALPVSGFSLVGPVVRQVQRGKKKKVTP